jgi:beta-glucosidase
LLSYRVDSKPTAPVQLSLRDASGRVTSLDLTQQLSSAPMGEWRSLKVRLLSFRASGADMAKVIEPAVITTAGQLQLTLQTLRLESDPAGAIQLPAAP